MRQHVQATYITATLLAVTTGILFASPRQASATSVGPSYRLQFSTDVGLLDNPNDQMLQLQATWKTPQELVALRNAPLVRLTNLSETESMTSFLLDIADTEAVFDAWSLIQSPGGITPTVASPLDSLDGGLTSTVFQISFAEPLAPGQFVTYRIDLDHGNGNSSPVPDYRKIFWDKDDVVRDNNVRVQATFVGEEQLADLRVYEYPFANQQFDTTLLDGANGSSQVVPGMSAGHAGDLGVFVFQQGGVTPVPEPSSIALAVLGIAAAGLFGWRRRAARRTDAGVAPA